MIWVQHTSDDAAPGQRAVAVRRRAAADGVRAARPQALRRLVRGHRPRVRARRARGRPPRRHRRPDRRLRPIDAARRHHPRLRHRPRRRRPHHGGPLGVGRTAARPGDLPHQPLLVVAIGTRPHRRGHRHRRGQLPAGRGTSHVVTLTDRRRRRRRTGRHRGRWRPPGRPSPAPVSSHRATRR